MAVNRLHLEVMRLEDLVGTVTSFQTVLFTAISNIENVH